MIPAAKFLTCLLATSLAAAAFAQAPAKSDPTQTSNPNVEGGVQNLPAPSAPADPGFGPRGVPCTANAGNCLEFTGTTVADPRTSDLIGGGFSVADNFQPTVSGNISAICFTGYYGPGVPVGAAVPASGSEAFRITIWQTSATGLPAAQVAQIFVGANASTTLGTVTYTGTLSRSTGLGTPSSLANTTMYAWTASGLSIPVTTGTCYWMEITAATAGLTTNSRWRWVNSLHASGAGSYADGVCLQTANGGTATYASIVNAFDRAFCLTIGASSNVLGVPTCGIPAAPPNNACTAAINITTLPYNAPADTTTYRSFAEPTPFCGTSPVNGNTLWYKVTGTGTTLTASTCGAATNFDTIINVYCLSGASTCGTNNTNLLCVANNDAGPASCVGDGGPRADPSQVSWVGSTGVTYYIAVFGYFASNAPVGAVSFQLASDGIQAAAVSCVSDRCPVDLSAITGVTEADTCSNTVDTNNACGNTANVSFALNTWLKGTLAAAAPSAGVPGNSRDVDYWEYNTATPLPDNSGGGGQSILTITWQSEAPILLSFYTGACTTLQPAGANVGAFVGRYRPTLNGFASNGPCGPLAADIATPSANAFRILATLPDFGGVPCASGNNNYALKVDLAVTGACCVPSVACTLSTSGQCVTNGGTFAGNNVTCASLPCPGACCNNGACTAVLNAAACSGAYQGEGSTCALTNCPAPSGICCRGATCNTLLPQPNCTVTGSIAGVAFPPGPNCSGSTITACCYADYNKINGIEVQDIFDFINDWLAGSPFANTGGSGSGGTLAVQNIFDFLNGWFAGCTP